MDPVKPPAASIAGAEGTLGQEARGATWPLGLGSALIGALVLIGFSTLQKLGLGVSHQLVFRPGSFVVPVLFGGSMGFLLGRSRARLKQAVAGLHDQVERSSAIMAATQAGVIVVDRATHRIVEANHAAQLEQVVVNLVVNANDAIADGGRITLQGSVVELDAAFVELNRFGAPGPYALLTVVDTGAGMTPSVLERIFDPFFTTKEVGRGTGLGLSIVHGIVGQHGGHIKVYSEPGLGTTFRIYLPLLRQGVVAPVEAIPLTPPPGGRETILLAEDDADIRELLTTVLERAGYQVLAAANGDEALPLYRQAGAQVDLALLDVIMPGQRGDRVGREILRWKRDARVVFMSGYAGEALDAADPDVTDPLLLAKPISPRNLLEQVRAALDRPGPVTVRGLALAKAQPDL
jgi:CheY-like chemotaxis protein